MLEEKFVTLLSVTKLLYIFFSNLAVWLTVDCSVYEARSVFLGHKVGGESNRNSNIELHI